MKNYIALLLVVILSLSVLFGCGATGDNNETTLSAENTASQAENLTQSETQNSSEGAVNTEAETTVAVQQSEFTAQTLIDDEEVSVVVTNCVMDTVAGFVMNTYLENKTEDPVVFEVTASALNGKDMHPAFTQEVNPGEVLTVPMVWSEDKLANRQIVTVEEVKIELQIVSYGEEIREISRDIYTIVP